MYSDAKAKIRLLPFMPAIAWAMVILVLSVMPGIQMPEAIFSPDKLGHFVAYGLLTGLFLHGLRKSGALTKQTSWLSVLAASLYGILLEIVQWAFFPYRFFEVWDMIANITGAFLCLVVYSYFITKN